MLWTIPGWSLGVSPRRRAAVSALHVAALAAAAPFSTNGPDRRHHPGGNQSGGGSAERLSADGALLGDTFNLYGAVLRRHLGCAQ